jgi:hypothetical protein
VRICNGERVLEDLLDRTPYVDDLVAGLQETVSFLREVMWNPGLGRGVALINVNAVDGST